MAKLCGNGILYNVRIDKPVVSFLCPKVAGVGHGHAAREHEDQRRGHEARERERLGDALQRGSF